MPKASSSLPSSQSPASVFRHNEISLSLETLIECAPILGIHQEDRARILCAQDDTLFKSLQAHSNQSVSDLACAENFYFGCLDFLMTRDAKGQLRYFPIEMNGTGMAGITSVHADALSTLLDALQTIPKYTCPDEVPVIIVPYSGTESLKSSGSSPMRYERILYADAIRKGLKARYGAGRIETLNVILDRGSFNPTEPTVVLGHLKDLVRFLTFENNRAYLLGSPVSGSMHDQFCEVIRKRLDFQVSAKDMFMVNNIFPVVSDKGDFAQWINRFCDHYPERAPGLDGPLLAEHANTPEALVDSIERHLKDGRKLVIKPSCTGLGRGIEFFLAPCDRETIFKKVHESITAAITFYGEQDNVFPYTICEYKPSVTLPDKAHEFYGHNFELRIVVYRNAATKTLQACPSIVKIASQKFEVGTQDRLKLLNNVAASSQATGVDGTRYILPLCRPDTLKTIDVSTEILEEMCLFSTSYVRYVMENLPFSI